ncbi:MAG: hypothetical protein ACI8TP_000290 [Acidimicrobiales bacterium]|jgi:hypothetical protein
MKWILAGVALLGSAALVGATASSDALDLCSPEATATSTSAEPAANDFLSNWMAGDDLEAPASTMSMARRGESGDSEPPSDDVAEDQPLGTPVAVRVPIVEIGVELDPLGLDEEGGLEVPEDFSRGGWFADGPKPGAVGPAVITAHVDSFDGPAPFFRLSEMAVGDEIDVLMSNGDTVTFVATRVEEHAKDEFPTLEVHGNTDQPELRLITCGGDFDRNERSYRHNIIVWATSADALGEQADDSLT